MTIPYHFDLGLRLKGLNLENYKCINFGSSDYGSDIARQLIDIPFKELVSVEAYPPMWSIIQNIPFKAKKHRLLKKNICDVCCGFADIGIAMDVLEHITKEQGEKFLDTMDSSITKRMIILVPREPDGFHRKNPTPDNIFNEHISYWREEDFLKRGYEVETMTDFHAEFDEKTQKNLHWNAIWAVKNYG
jgi:hypothetical protein